MLDGGPGLGQRVLGVLIGQLEFFGQPFERGREPGLAGAGLHVNEFVDHKGQLNHIGA